MSGRVLTRGWAGGVLAGLLAADAAVLALHGVSVAAGLEGYVGWKMQVTADGGVAEVAGYGKVLAAAFLLVAMRDRWRAALAWLPALALLLADDALGLHEAAGSVLAGVAAFPHAQDVGEVGAMAVLGLVGVAPVVVAYLRDGRIGRRFTRSVAGVLAGFAAFAVGVDAAHAVVGAGGAAGSALGVVEDGGELVMLSVLVAVLVSWYRDGYAANAYVLTRRPRAGMLAVRPEGPGDESPERRTR